MLRSPIIIVFFRVSCVLNTLFIMPVTLKYLLSLSRKDNNNNNNNLEKTRSITNMNIYYILNFLTCDRLYFFALNY